MSLEWVSSIAISLGSAIIGSVIWGLFSYILNKRAENAKLLAAEEKIFDKVIASDSIDQLGAYLDNKLGRFLVSEYVNNNTVQHRVNSILTSIQDFVGREKEIETDIATPENLLSKEGQPKDEFKIVFEKLESGIAWDALAALRRFTEIKLKDLAESKGIKVGEKSSAGRMASILAKRGVLSKEMEQSLLYSINVANSAIHGIDVPMNVAEEAIWTAQNVLEQIGLLENRNV